MLKSYLMLIFFWSFTVGSKWKAVKQMACTLPISDLSCTFRWRVSIDIWIRRWMCQGLEPNYVCIIANKLLSLFLTLAIYMMGMVNLLACFSSLFYIPSTRDSSIHVYVHQKMNIPFKWSRDIRKAVGYLIGLLLVFGIGNIFLLVNNFFDMILNLGNRIFDALKAQSGLSYLYSWTEHALRVTDIVVGRGLSNSIIISSSEDRTCKVQFICWYQIFFLGMHVKLDFKVAFEARMLVLAKGQCSQVYLAQNGFW